MHSLSFIFFIFYLFSIEVVCQIIEKEEVMLKKSEVLEKKGKTKFIDLGKLDSFYDPLIDYRKFSGRLTDKAENGTIFKIQVEAKNTKFFQISDVLFFNALRKKGKIPCRAYIRSIEANYITVFVKSVVNCWGSVNTFRRGSIMIFNSEILAKRIKSASSYRVALFAKKRDYIYQLNKINKSIWSYKEEQVAVAAEYDEKIIELKKRRMKALEKITLRRKNNIKVRKNLSYKVDEIGRDLDFYRVEKDQLFSERWHFDKDLGKHIYRTPSRVKKLK